MNASAIWKTTKTAVMEWSEDKASRLAASLAFYTMLSIAPLLVIVLKIVGAIWGEEAARGQLFDYINEMVGAQGAEQLQEMVQQAGQPGAGVIATVISSVILLFSGSYVFAELQDSLNTIWDVQPKPNRPWWGVIKDRLFSFALVLVVAFMLLVSLILSSVLSIVSRMILGDASYLAWGVDFVVSFAVITLLFALMFKYLPDVKVGWRAVWMGAVITSVLFIVGKFILGWYLGRASTTSVYGAAGSLVALLLWVYYSAQIFFFGAELTQVVALERGHRGPVSELAQPMDPQQRVNQGLVRNDVQPPRALPVPPVIVRPQFRREPSKVQSPLAAGAGLLAGLAVGFYAGWDRLRRRQLDRAMQRTRLDERLDHLESRMSRIQAFKKYSQDYGIRQRIDRAEQELANVGRELRRLERNPEIAPTLGDYLRYVFGARPRRASFGRRLARALHVDRLIASE